jgi:hypothetical protein
MSGAAADALLTASPQTMASREVNANMVANVMGKIIDDVDFHLIKHHEHIINLIGRDDIVGGDIIRFPRRT